MNILFCTILRDTLLGSPTPPLRHRTKDQRVTNFFLRLKGNLEYANGFFGAYHHPSPPTNIFQLIENLR